MKVLFATVLKPVTDTRVAEKLAPLFFPKAEVHIFGRIISFEKKFPFVFHDAGIKTRAFRSRWRAQIAFVKTLVRLNPTIVVVGAIELLWIAFCLKKILGFYLIYDIRENYRRNVRYQNIYPILSKPLLLIWIWITEALSVLFVNEYWLAEVGYEQELSFFKKKSYKIVENKFAIYHFFYSPKVPISFKEKPIITFAIVGTLSETFGTMRAIRFFEEYSRYFAARLFITGMAASKNIYEQVMKLSSQINVILNVSEIPISHGVILQTMCSSDIVMLPYMPNKSTQNCIPTKLYECLALGIPMLLSENLLWEKLIIPHSAGIFTNFLPSDVKNVHQKIIETVFYPKGFVKEAYFDHDHSFQTHIEKLLCALS
ncbi:MAG: hypothetical protein NZM38_05835 [Cytophagales bacterium]|nr:hypothetical protein [Cytophagales bacterium]MDW8384275.1 hypothetical protein [Flammeovirgaceae bacterium]